MSFTIYDKTSGRIRMAISGTREMAVARAQKGEAIFEGWVDPRTHEIRGGKPCPKKTAAADEFAASKRRSSDKLRLHCRHAIISGFTSDALGTVHHYPNAETDQLNRLTAAAAGVAAELPCADAAGVWARRSHSAEQLRAVCAAGAAWAAACLTKHDALGAQLAKAKTEAALSAVTWKSEKEQGQ